MIINSKHGFHNNNKCGIKSDSNQDDTTIRIGSLGNDNIDVKENKCHNTVVKEPENYMKNYHEAMNFTLS